MNLPRKTISFKNIPAKFYAYLLFIVLHVALFNVNTAEWGDSYRILRASEYIRQGSYPSDEKRPPLFSALTAVRPNSVDPVVWGRVVVFIFSFLSLIVFDKLTQIYIKNEKYRFVSLILFILNPVYLYWSIRVMADVPFSFFVLLAFYLLSKYYESLKQKEIDKDYKINNFKSLIFMGIVCGLSILTRFEGYLLFLSVFIGVIFSQYEIFFKKIKIKELFYLIKKNWQKAIVLGLTTLITILPWLLYRNPLESEYFEEPSRRTYNFNTIWIYLSSILYIFGFTSAFFFIIKSSKNVLDFLNRNISITTFMIVELLLILVWPAAIPRLFLPLIPFFVLILTISLESYFKNYNNGKKADLSSLVGPVFLLFFYILSQYFLKLQFLVPVKVAFATIVLIQIFSLLSFYFGKVKIFFYLVLVSITFWSISAIFNHKDIYTAIKSAGIYARDNLDGKIVFNDTTSIADWYINYSYPQKDLIGEKWDFSDKKRLNYEYLLENDVSYVLVTNEDNSSFDLNMKNFKHLKLIQSFRYNIGSKEFFASIFEFKKIN
jgi:hypothetical protein